jgi:methylenetetrahydrofolate reductase (NADPH)
MFFVVVYKEETEYLLVDCHYLGINNVMAFTWWCYERRTVFVADGGNNFAVDLVGQINLLNEGKYLHDVMHIDNKADFVLVWLVIQKNI